MARRTAGAAIALALLSSCGLLKKKTKTTGIAECDLYIAEYECFMKKSAGELAARKAAESLAEGFNKAAANGTGPVAQSCNTQRSAMAEQLKAQGCLLGAPPADPLAAALVPDAGAPAPPVTKASTPAPAPAPAGTKKNGDACTKTADCFKGIQCVAHGGLKTCEDATMKNGCPMSDEYGVFDGTLVEGGTAVKWCGECPPGTTIVKGGNVDTCKPGGAAPAPAADAGSPTPSKLPPMEAACEGKKGRDKCTFNGKPGECRSALGGNGEVKLMCAIN